MRKNLEDDVNTKLCLMPDKYIILRELKLNNYLFLSQITFLSSGIMVNEE